NILSVFEYPKTYRLIRAFLEIKDKNIKNNNIELFNNIVKKINIEFQLFNRKIEKMSLFNYIKINKNTIDVIYNNKIWIGHSKYFNDPIDPYIKTDISYKEILDKIKVSCLTTHNDNTLMWSHYADKHQGICIEYDITSIHNRENLILKKVNYEASLTTNNINYYTDTMGKLFNNVKTSDNRNIDYIIDTFTVKSKEWEYEDEYRILFYDEENKNPNGRSIDLQIKSICFGVQTSKEDKELVYNIVNSINEKRLDYNNDIIKLYQAELDDNELFKINIKPYKHGNDGS
ncbi:DUF2971 domain-containing protein, partial [Brachyspira hampsonii]